MEELSKKVEYLKGFADGLDISPKSDEGKLLRKIVEVMGEMADAVEEIKANQNETDEIVEDMEEDFLAVLEDLYGDDYEDDDDYDYEDDDEDDFLDDDYENYDEDDDVDYFEIQCPSCGEDVMIDFDMIDEENGIVCPNCHEEIELEFECDCDDDDCDCHDDEDEDEE